MSKDYLGPHDGARQWEQEGDFPKIPKASGKADMGWVTFITQTSPIAYFCICLIAKAGFSPQAEFGPSMFGKVRWELTWR